MKNLTIIKLKKLSEESGQMLLFVVVILFVLFIVVLGVIVNVRVDVKEAQLERNYESGYAKAENVLFDIKSSGFDPDNYISYSGSLCSGGSECDGGSYECFKYDSDEDGSEDTIIKVCDIRGLSLVTIPRDDTYELTLEGMSRSDDISNVSWDTAPAISMMLVCSNGSDYENTRMAVCRSGSGDCGEAGLISGFKSIVNAQSNGPLDMGSCSAGFDPVTLRLRAIGANAENVNITDDDLPIQSTIYRVQAFELGEDEIFSDENLKGNAGPEIYSVVPKVEPIPSIFDYVLYSSNDSISH